LGVERPRGYTLSLNNAVDKLLKKEFDIHRAKGSSHPLMRPHGIKAVPYAHEELAKWRDSLAHGVKYFHKPTNLLIRGGIDDIWVNSKGELHVVEYKATSKDEEVSLDADWQERYKRQVEVYQWLFRKNGFRVSDVAYFVYCNGKTDKRAFDAKLEFDISVIPYKGSDGWVEKTILNLAACLRANRLPAMGETCNYCAYYENRSQKRNVQ
jgi:hypothetical protein